VWSSGRCRQQAHADQNRAKSRFCATRTPIPVTDEAFKTLKCAADQNDLRYGSSHRLPLDQDVLKRIIALPNGTRLGAGEIVEYVASSLTVRALAARHRSSIGRFHRTPTRVVRGFGRIEMTQNSGEKRPPLVSDSKFGTDLSDTISGGGSRRERHAPVRSRAQDSA